MGNMGSMIDDMIEKTHASREIGTNKHLANIVKLISTMRSIDLSKEPSGYYKIDLENGDFKTIEYNSQEYTNYYNDSYLKGGYYGENIINLLKDKIIVGPERKITFQFAGITFVIISI